VSGIPARALMAAYLTNILLLYVHIMWDTMKSRIEVLSIHNVLLWATLCLRGCHDGASWTPVRGAEAPRASVEVATVPVWTGPIVIPPITGGFA
jgi:hypothetical protein